MHPADTSSAATGLDGTKRLHQICLRSSECAGNVNVTDVNRSLLGGRS